MDKSYGKGYDQVNDLRTVQRTGVNQVEKVT